MKERSSDFSQPVRLLFLLIYLAFLFAMNRLGFDQWLPLTNPKGLWFYSGAAALILGSLLVTPFFTSPANAISYLIAALIAILAFTTPSSAPLDMLPKLILVSFCLIMLTVCCLSIILKANTNRWPHNIAESCRILADTLGRPRFVYAIIIAYALWEYHRANPWELFFVGVSGIVIAAQQPIETFSNMIQRIHKIWRPSTGPQIIGTMVAHQIPDLLLIRQDGTEAIDPGSCLLIADAHAPFKIGTTLGYCGRDEGVLLRAIEITVPKQHRTHLEDLTKHVSGGSVCFLDQTETDAFRDDVYLLKRFNSLIGIVAPESSTERLYFEIIHERDIEQGRLVEAFVGNNKVLYQILDGLTKEEIIQQKNTYGYSRGEAVQIGIWDEVKRKFRPCNWIPRLNSPVFLKAVEKQNYNEKAVGHFPLTSYDVEIKNLDELVTHNTAILGILGVGKSMLAIELVERMIAYGIKVVCIDLTNQYANELAHFYDSAYEAKCLKAIQSAGEIEINSVSDHPEKGGSIQHLRKAIYKDLEQFLKKDAPHNLKIYNPAALSATKQEQEPKSFKVGNEWQRSAGLWRVTPVEITCIITEICLSLLQNEMTDKAQVCIVFEEAHSLVPEWNSVASEGDKTATNGTARAILQGRKYGLGCLLVTQRTANVTKTILNQCNTIFAMRTFDDTGKEFLSNYIGSGYASKLPSLRERHAVFFGRASSCENPVMIRLNDRADFLRVFRENED